MTEDNMSKEEKLNLIQRLIDENNGEPDWDNIAKEVHYGTAEGARSFYRRNKQEKVSDRMSGTNERDVTSVSDTITSVPELLAHCKIDLDEWIVVSQEIAKTTSKIAADVEKDLSWTSEGVMSGYNKRGPTQLIPIVRIKVSLVRRVPITIEPPIQPVELQYTIKKPKAPKLSKKVMRRLVFGDQQVGYFRDELGNLQTYHDDNAMDIAVQLCASIEVDGVDNLGDLNDWAEFSRFTTTPNQYGLGQSSLLRAHHHLARIRDAQPDAEMTIQLGNHDLRPESAVKQNLMGLYGLKKVDQLDLPPIYHPAYLMAFDKLHIKWGESYPDGEFWLNEYLRIIHGNKAVNQSGKTVTAIINAGDVSEVFGHIHRAELAMKTLWNSKGMQVRMAWSPGCLCKVDGSVPAHKKRNNWQQAVSIAEYTKDSQVPTVTMIPIVNGKAIYGGREYAGKFDIKKLKRDTGWEHF